MIGICPRFYTGSGMTRALKEGPRVGSEERLDPRQSSAHGRLTSLGDRKEDKPFSTALLARDPVLTDPEASLDLAGGACDPIR